MPSSEVEKENPPVRKFFPRLPVSDGESCGHKNGEAEDVRIDNDGQNDGNEREEGGDAKSFPETSTKNESAADGTFDSGSEGRGDGHDVSNSGEEWVEENGGGRVATATGNGTVRNASRDENQRLVVVTEERFFFKVS